jgi:hypothetical protein
MIAEELLGLGMCIMPFDVSSLLAVTSCEVERAQK